MGLIEFGVVFGIVKLIGDYGRVRVVWCGGGFLGGDILRGCGRFFGLLRGVFGFRGPGLL